MLEGLCPGLNPIKVISSYLRRYFRSPSPFFGHLQIYLGKYEKITSMGLIPGLVVKAKDLRSKGHGFDSRNS